MSIYIVIEKKASPIKRVRSRIVSVWPATLSLSNLKRNKDNSLSAKLVVNFVTTFHEITACTVSAV